MNAELSCPSRDQLERLLLGAMPAAEMEGLKGHLAGCPSCLEAMRAVTTEDALVLAVRAGGKAGNIAVEEADPTLLTRLRRLPAEVKATVSASPQTWTPVPEKVEELCSLLAPPQEPDELGRFGSYGILRSLGTGGMGAVFAARQTQPRRIVALKMIRTASRVGRQQLARFRSETEIIAQLQHPNIVPVYEVGEHDGRPYYTMEFLEGGSLTQKLAAAPLSPRAAAELALVLTRAVHFAHERSIVHRDLKPANVLLAADSTPKIADFGLAKQFGREPDEPGLAYRTESGAILGTPGYMAPEQVHGSKAVGPAADVYALGAILYECLTGRPPFRAATVWETLEQIRSQEPAPVSRLQPKTPQDLQTICQKCLHKEPGRRYDSAAALADDLGRFLRGEPIRARPVSLRERLWKWVRRRPALAFLLAVTGLSLAALVASSLVYNSQLRAAVERAESHEAEARRQHEQAANSYRAARDTLDRMLERLDSRRTSGVPQFGELLRDLQEDVLTFYRRVSGVEDPDPMVRRDTAHALARAGGLQFVLGQKGPAAENLRGAVALLEALPPEQRSEPLCQDLLAGCYIYLGQIAASGGERLDEWECAYRQAFAIRERLAEAYPDDPEFQNQVAQTELLLGTMYQHLGYVYRDSARWVEAEFHYKRALAVHARLVEMRSANNVYRAGQAGDCVFLGHLYRLMQRPAEAGAAFAKAEELLAPLVEAQPRETQYSLTLENLYIVWSDFLRETGQPESALRYAGRAVDLAERLLRCEPRHSIARAHAREAHVKRAAANETLGRWADAIKDWERVVELEEQPKAWQQQRLLQARDRANVRK